MSSCRVPPPGERPDSAQAPGRPLAQVLREPGDPFYIEGPASISFSGGRSSAYLVYRVLVAHGGVLPPDVHVCFANTGREHPGTLDFVQNLGESWGIRIVWLEYDGRHGKRDYREVNYESAARNGEPFARLIERKRALPNWQARWCTQTLKVERIQAFMRSRYREWTDVVGLRHDEPLRVARVKARVDPEVTYALPLDAAGVTVEAVRAHWRSQLIDLGVHEGGGNCDLCFLKGVRILRTELARDPAAADWWIAQEAATGRTFSKRFSYAELQAAALVPVERLTGRQLALAVHDEPTPDCSCTD